MLLSSEIRYLRNLVSSEQLWRRQFPLQSWCNCIKVRNLPPWKTVGWSIIESDTLLSRLHVAVNVSNFPVAACVASRCVVQISGLFCVFYFGENLEAIWALRRRLKRRICDANIGVLFFVWWLVIRVVTWTGGREGETQIILSYIWLIKSRYQWPRGLRYGSATAGLLGLRFRIPPWHGCLFLVSVVRCQEEVSATG